MQEQPKIIILGNGPINTDLTEQVNHCPRVVRFNHCAAMPDYLGQRCTDLWLVGRGRQALSLLNTPQMSLEGLSQVMITDPTPNSVAQFFFKLIQRKGKVDFGEALISAYAQKCQVERLTAQFRQSLLNELLALGSPIHRPRCVSSGTLAIAYFLVRFKYVHIAGFGFQGWKRHPWNLEKQFVEQLVAEKRVILLDS
ncbi:hypothetical protein [Pseudoalteromonas sp. PB2-1]|uniref:hypothetical protein n=1 Tax=Pseudoalteromonas sp. PB2-1 TaxID=2907242 RepID=UPI003867EFE0|tara:strand:- start:5144 stop:5734 length:591 start_codon:yes stop_codon:yes gene_type:complete